MSNIWQYPLPEQDADRAEVMENSGEEEVPPRRLLKEPEGVVKDGVEEAQPTPGMSRHIL